jgi:branched-chain amino acid aminotransferase
LIHRFVFHNDRLLPVDEVRLSPGQAGLLNGWGLFTTIRIVSGIPFAFERHWKRLKRDSERTHCPFPFDPADVRGKLDQLLLANQVREGCARIYAVYNQGFWSSNENFPPADLILYSSDLPSYREPVRLGLRENGRHAASPLAGVKVTSWLNNVWNLHEAHQAGFDETVMLNERGEVSECTAANIFCVRGERVYTPPLDSGCLSGITRSVLLEIGSGVGAPVAERTLLPEELYSADEVFISSTNRSMLGVSEIHGHRIASAPGPVTLRLEKAFADYVRAYIESKSAASGYR